MAALKEILKINYKLVYGKLERDQMWRLCSFIGKSKRFNWSDDVAEADEFPSHILDKEGNYVGFMGDNELELACSSREKPGCGAEESRRELAYIFDSAAMTSPVVQKYDLN